jgi:hypothetical protein
MRQQSNARRPRRRQSSMPGARKAREDGRSLDPSGFDAAKTVPGRKRHLLVDTQASERQYPCRAYSRSRRRGSATAESASSLFFRGALRRLCRTGNGGSGRANRGLDPGDRKTLEPRSLRAAQARDRRTHLGLNQRQSAFGRDDERSNRTEVAFVTLTVIRLMLRRMATSLSTRSETFRSDPTTSKLL